MTTYHSNEAILQLPNLIRPVVDLTRHCLQVVTEEGAELQLVIERSHATTSLSAALEADLAERRRSLRGFELASVTEREYPEVMGSEVRSTFVEKERGPVFAHEFHCVIGGTHVAYACSCRLAQAAACDAWMQTMLHYLRLR